MGTPRSDSMNSFRWVREIGVIKKLMKLISGEMKLLNNKLNGNLGKK
jgi:hypothetical protein